MKRAEMSLRGPELIALLQGVLREEVDLNNLTPPQMEALALVTVLKADEAQFSYRDNAAAIFVRDEDGNEFWFTAKAANLRASVKPLALILMSMSDNDTEAEAEVQGFTPFNPYKKGN